MYTPTMLNTPTNNKNKRIANKYKGILTKKEAVLHLSTSSCVYVVASMEDKVFFFVDDYCYGYGVLSSHYVPISTPMPIRVTPRPGLESGLVVTIDDYISVFEHDCRLIESAGELADFLNDQFVSEKLIIEKRAFDDFMASFKKGAYGSQRLGQAFYDQFKLGRIRHQERVNGIYNKDGEKALSCIYATFEFN